MSKKAKTARTNGAKSNGPVTETGKAISSQNSLKHGLTSARVVLPHESQEEYDGLETSLVNRFKPYDEIEHALVRQMAASFGALSVSKKWRRRFFTRRSSSSRNSSDPKPTPRNPHRRLRRSRRVKRTAHAVASSESVAPSL